MTPATNPFAAKSERLRRKAKSITAPRSEEERKGDIKRRRVKIDVLSEELPIPAIVRATLIALGGQDDGRFEKVAWSIGFGFDSMPCQMEDQKLGLNLHMWPPADASSDEVADLARRVITTLKGAIRVAEEDFFYPEIKQKMANNEVILANHIIDLRGAYIYFRARAEQKSKARASKMSNAEDVAERLVEDFMYERGRVAERKYLVVAMVVAYYSYLEHFLAHALPFSKLSMADVNITEFLGKNWGEKFKAVIDVSNLPEAKTLYDRLVHVAETHRNPRSHGNYDKQGSTLGVRLEQIGTVPVLLTGIEKKPSFRFDPFDDESLEEITNLFDEVEELLSGPLLGNAGKWISCALDTEFTQETLDAYHLPPDEFEAYCERQSELWEREVNMDW